MILGFPPLAILQSSVVPDPLHPVRLCANSHSSMSESSHFSNRLKASLNAFVAILYLYQGWVCSNTLPLSGIFAKLGLKDISKTGPIAANQSHSISHTVTWHSIGACIFTLLNLMLLGKRLQINVHEARHGTADIPSLTISNPSRTSNQRGQSCGQWPDKIYTWA